MNAGEIEGYALSPQQQQVWRWQGAGPHTPFWASATVMLEGALDEAGLRAALALLVERQEILRTNFACLPGLDLPLQVIAAPSPPHLLDPERLLAEPAVFNWTHGSLLEVALVRQSAERHRLLVRLPALCADRATLALLGAELSRCYASVVAGHRRLGQPVQYADLAAWLAELLSAPDAAGGRALWAAHALDGLADQRLPAERPPTTSAFAPHCLAVPLPSSLARRLRALAAQQGCALADLLLACWLALLARRSERTALVVGVAYSGRPYPELASALGPLAQSVPLVCQLEPMQPFTALLAQVQAERQASEPWQLYFAWDSVKPATSPSEGPAFFPWCFEHVSLLPPWQAAGVTFTLTQSSACSERFGLKLVLVEQPAGLTAELHYDAQRFPAAAAQHLADAYQALVEQVLAEPATPLHRLPRLGARERHQALVAFNPRPDAGPPPPCLQHRVEEIAARSPERLAVRVEEQTLTYAQLNAQASQLAAHLQRQGVQPEVCVAVYLERSLDSLVALLAIFKAGGVYVPLDPTWPPARLAFILAETQPAILLTDQRLRPHLPATTASVLCLDDLGELGGQAPAALRTSPLMGTNLAYVLYTSGSTGQPKGVAVPHQAIAHYLASLSQRLTLSDGASFAAVSTLAADLAYTAIFAAWWQGGCVHLITPQRAADSDRLGEYLQQHAVAGLKIVPTHLAALLSGSQPAALLPQRWLLLGGEAVSWALLDTLSHLAPPCAIVNHYGPTESTIGVLTECLYPAAAPRPPTPPLGRPLAHSPVYLLDAALDPVPLGQVGDLYIGGASLARGYLHHPALTAERFRPDPFATTPGARLYHTGDRARQLPDGRIEFVGRTDEQVKLRGYRIELGEIEAVLRQHPQVRQAVVLLRPAASGEPQLVAYLVLQPSTAPPLRALQAFVQQHLPEYMAPQAVVVLDAFPLTANGKLDRQALPAPAAVSAAAERPPYVPPRSDLEAVLAALWAQVLQVEPIGIHDNFFALGGDSILSIQIIARAGQAGLHLTPRQLFSYPTIAQLATLVAPTPIYQPAQTPVSGPTPFTPIQHWFFEQNLPDPHHYNQALLLETHQPLDPTALEQAVTHLLAHHDALRLRFTCQPCGWQAAFAAIDAATPFTYHDLAALTPAEQRQAIETTASAVQPSLHLSQGPLLRVVAFDLGEQRPGRLLLVAHHLVVDGVSWSILLADLHTLYSQARQGEPLRLPPKTTSYQQWAQGLVAYAHSTALQQELPYWLVAMALPPRLPIDVAGAGAANTVASAHSVAVALSAAETEALLRTVPSAYNTHINDALLTALLQAFVDWSGERTLLVELEGHGREEIIEGVDLSRTVGWFTTRFPVLLSLEDTSNPGAALKSVKEQLRRVPQRGIGYGVLRYLTGEEDIAQQLAARPQPEVSFNYMGQLDRELAESTLFRWATESSGLSRSPQGLRRYVLDINGMIVDNQLQMTWTYSENIHRRGTIEQLAERFIRALRSLIRHCQSPQAGGYTPSDFPAANLSQEDLDRFVTRLASQVRV